MEKSTVDSTERLTRDKFVSHSKSVTYVSPSMVVLFVIDVIVIFLSSVSVWVSMTACKVLKLCSECCGFSKCG